MIIQHADLLPEEEQPYVHAYLPFSKVKSYLSPQGTLVRQHTQLESYSFMDHFFMLQDALHCTFRAESPGLYFLAAFHEDVSLRFAGEKGFTP